MTGQEPLPDFDRMWNYEDPAGTEARFREILPGARESGDVQYLASLLTQIARAQGLQGRIPEANGTLDEAQEILPKGPSVAIARLMLERGRLLNSGGDPAMALPLFRDAWEVARDCGAEAHAVDALHMLAIAAPPEEQAAWAERAIAAAEASSDRAVRGWLGPLCNNLGWTYHDRGDYARALACWERGVAVRLDLGESDVRIARWCVARAQRSLGRVEEALATQRDLLPPEGDLSWNWAGYVHEEVAECLLTLDRGEEARPHFATAYAVLSRDPWLAEHEAARLERLRALGAAPSGE